MTVTFAEQNRLTVFISFLHFSSDCYGTTAFAYCLESLLVKDEVRQKVEGVLMGSRRCISQTRGEYSAGDGDAS